MAHAESVNLEGGLIKTMTEDKLKTFTPSELLLYKHAVEYRYRPVHWATGLLYPSLIVMCNCH
jgi:hypothetical protein